MAGLLVGETCSGMLDLRAWFGGSVESKTGSLLLGLDRLADQEGPVIGLDASHLPLLVDGLADSSCRSGGFPELDENGQQRRLQFLGIGVQHAQSVQDPLPQRLAGNVCLLVPGPARGGDPLAASKIRAKSPGRTRFSGVWSDSEAGMLGTSDSTADHDQRLLPTILSNPAPTGNPAVIMRTDGDRRNPDGIGDSTGLPGPTRYLNVHLCAYNA